MKKFLILIILPLLVAAHYSTVHAKPPTYGITIQAFYNSLAPYGTWLYDDHYGYVWLPDEGDSFRPYYSNGYWAMTEFGNTWISFYHWGWAPFHYGRWMYDPYYGWLWIPGYEWGPAWVSWRFGKDLYGWAPLMPGTEVTEDMHNPCPDDWWIFVPQYLIYASHSTALYDASPNSTILPGTTEQNNIYYNQFRDVNYVMGPSQEEVCRVTSNFICEQTGQNVMVFKLQNLRSPDITQIKDCIIYLYRPDIVKTENDWSMHPDEYSNVPKLVNSIDSIGNIIRRSPFKDKLDMMKRRRATSR